MQCEISLLRKRLLRRAQIDCIHTTGKRKFKKLKRNIKKLSSQKEVAELQAVAAVSRAEKLERKALAAKAQEERAKQHVKDAMQLATEAQRTAAEARKQLMKEEAAAREADNGRNQAEYATFLAKRREERAKDRANKLQERLDMLAPPTKQRSVDDWLALSYEAQRKAAQREREHLLSFFSSHQWRMIDVADVLYEMGWAEAAIVCHTVLSSMNTSLQSKN